MASKRINESGATEFPAPHTYGNDSPGYRGRFFTFFKKRFGPKPKKGRPTAAPPLAGDADVQDGFGDNFGVAGSSSKTSFAVPRVEYERRRRYKDYEKMDEYPEIAAAIDIYGDDSCQEDIKKEMFDVETPNEMVREEITKFLEHVKLDKHIWDIVRNVAKYGDCFIENIVDLNAIDTGIQRIKVLNPNFIFREEDKFGYLKSFKQEIPDSNGADAGGMGAYSMAPAANNKRLVSLDKNQIVHFRRYTSDANFYPYGKSICAAAVAAWRSLKLMEDAMIIYRIQRAPERRAFYLETGNLPATKVEAFVERVKAKFKKQKTWNPMTNSIDENYNPLTVDEDFFIPVRNGMGTKIETLPGAQNLGDVEDVKYFKDKLLAALKIPKDYIVEKDKSPERKANLSQLDVKFAKTIMRLQRDVEAGLNQLLKRHLSLIGTPSVLIRGTKIKLQSPSDMYEKRRFEIDEQRMRIVQAVKGLQLFDSKYLLRTYFDMSETEADEMLERAKKQQKEDMEAMAPPMGAEGAPMPGGAPPAPGGAPPMSPPGGEGAPPQDAQMPPN